MKKKQRKKILITNDDGVQSPAIWALAKGLSALADCEVVAPQGPMSGVGHAVSLVQKIRLHPYRVKGRVAGYGIGGTPADAVKFAISELFGKNYFDLVVSGINLGQNTGVSVFYSGTIGAAREGIISGIPSFAVSIDSRRWKDFSYAVNLSKRIAAGYLDGDFPSDLFLNINIPGVKPGKIRGIRVTRQAPSQFAEIFEKTRENGEVHYRLKGDLVLLNGTPEMDHKALMEDYVSITPLSLDMTHYGYLEMTRSWFRKIPKAHR